MEALRKSDGLHEAAKANGGTFHISQTSYDFVRLTTLESLAENSDMAIIGIPIGSENRLINDGRNIVTEYEVKVQEPIQGKAQRDDVVTVDLPGGKIAFEDGTTAEVDVGDFPRLEIGHRYVIYLELIKELNIRQPLGGPEGVFELRADGKVTPFATPEYTQAAVKDGDVLEFLERVRDAARLEKRQ
jgi:hypothetical protein